jgi:tetratricopeptide (TPR) repeat protein
MLTFDYAKGHEVVGRAGEIDQLRSDLSGKKIKVIFVEGGLGVGKTALANRLLEMTSAGALVGRFHRQVWKSAYQDTWGRVMSQLAEKLVGRSAVLRATQSEIEERVLSFCSANSTFLVIDNLEVHQSADAEKFVSRWSEDPGESVLLITTREELPINNKHIRHLGISGLLDSYPQLQLMGDSLRKRFGAEELLKRVRILDGVPLSLLYIRWLDPKTEDELKQRVSGLLEGTVDKPSVLEEVLTSISRSPTHFMALGVIRQLQFDERLLAFFWDCMGGGNSTAYIEVRERLVSSRLLIPAQDQGLPMYRVSEDIHRQLYRALSARIGGEERIITVHFFASEFYRQKFESSETPALGALDSFVYHCFASGEHNRAYEYLFESHILPSLHQAGMALQLQGTLEAFIEKSEVFTSLQKCKILIEMASVCNDLSQFDQCLRLMSEADALVDSLEGEIAGSVRAELSNRIWYSSAVAYSNTGHSDQCLQSYLKIISAASNNDLASGLACVSLAYLAHDLKYHDIVKSVEYGKLALEIARELGDRRLIAKCLCSLGESFTYKTELSEANSCFEEASKLCQDDDIGPGDPRELGRVLKNWGVVAMIRREWDVAAERLKEARRISSSVGDRRRLVTADLYLAIIHYLLGNHQNADDLLLSVIRDLRGLGDGRYLVPAVMTYAWWKTPGYLGKRDGLANCENLEPIRDIVNDIGEHERFEIYAAFWRDLFKPVLFKDWSS